MGLYDEIFPTAGHPDLVQTQWAPGWGAAVSGFGYAAGFLTRHRAQFGATIDQAGIAIIYLQRHRVELALKELMHTLTGQTPGGHDLDALWTKCAAEVGPLDPAAWADFAGYRELVDVLHAVDDSSTVFRYPTNRDGSSVDRPAFINLDALNEACEKFEYAVAGYIDYWSERKHAGA